MEPHQPELSETWIEILKRLPQVKDSTSRVVESLRRNFHDSIYSFFLCGIKTLSPSGVVLPEGDRNCEDVSIEFRNDRFSLADYQKVASC